MLHKMRELGLSARVYDAAGGVGGTWYWNRYPGARCDIMSHAYSFSFDKDLEQEWEWSEKYATRLEILRYANHVAVRYELWPDMQFDMRIASSVFVESARRWTVRTDQADVVSAQHVVMATGTLSPSSATSSRCFSAPRTSVFVLGTNRWTPISSVMRRAGIPHIAMLSLYADLLVNAEANDTAADSVRQKIRDMVDDPEVAELLCPDNHPVGTNGRVSIVGITRRSTVTTFGWSTFAKLHWRVWTRLESAPLMNTSSSTVSYTRRDSTR